jgi:hypothetical protein
MMGEQQKKKEFQNETEIVNYLVEGYRKNGDYAVGRVNVAMLFKWGCNEVLKSIYHPMQPDIDILWYDLKEDILTGIEVKYFRPTKMKTKSKDKELLGINYEIQIYPKSYYVGVDEAVALLNYGVDHAFLFHVFATDKYSRWTEWLKSPLELTPIGYMVVIGSEAYELSKPMRNPLLKDDNLRKLRNCLIKGLKLMHVN